MFPQSGQALQKMQGTFKNLNDFKKAFRTYDSDGDGHNSVQELTQVIKGFTKEEVEAIFALSNKDQSGGML